jgi:hypothetical protein
MVAPDATAKRAKARKGRIRSRAGSGGLTGGDFGQSKVLLQPTRKKGPRPKWPGPCEVRSKIIVSMSVSLFLQALNAQVWPHPPPRPVHAELQKRLAIGR